MMHTTSTNITILSALNSAKSVEQMGARRLQHIPKLFRWLVESVLARRLEKQVFVLAEACNKLRIVMLDFQRRDDADLIDPDLFIRNSLESAKKDLLAQRLDMHESFKKSGFGQSSVPRFYAAYYTIIKLLSELYEISNEVQWAIAEHDASLSVQHEGFAASNAAELEAMLNQIASTA